MTRNTIEDVVTEVLSRCKDRDLSNEADYGIVHTALWRAMVAAQATGTHLDYEVYDSILSRAEAEAEAMDYETERAFNAGGY